MSNDPSAPRAPYPNVSTPESEDVRAAYLVERAFCLLASGVDLLALDAVLVVRRSLLLGIDLLLLGVTISDSPADANAWRTSRLLIRVPSLSIHGEEYYPATLVSRGVRYRSISGSPWSFNG